MTTDAIVNALAEARIGNTFNFYRDADRAGLLRRRLSAYLAARVDAPLLLVGEAPGYRGARVSGLPFTSERQLTGTGPAEATATIVQRVLAELEVADDVLLWNVVPTHPGSATSNRRPTRDEIAQGLPFVRELAHGRRVIAVGRLAETALGAPYVRHPSHGGAADFQADLATLLAGRRASTGRFLVCRRPGTQSPATSPASGTSWTPKARPSAVSPRASRTRSAARTSRNTPPTSTPVTSS